MDRFEELREKILPVLKPYVTRVAVFGSYVRGEETSDSDIDILAQLKPSEQRPPLGFKFFGLQEELGNILGREAAGATDSRRRQVAQCQTLRRSPLRALPILPSPNARKTFSAT